ncbi:MAG: LysE family translocator [Cryomorphaceae bacterium]|jgi:threonine/homoserine/homoserine lactone efflux protein|nr:LysE family translocator [Cryomorphaceae bacterium]MBT3503368.1 LysE family translocator [Cryomorphaceae bacterium]MBT3688821.1 LysE family translocator [Cryomorphaceae bacterium]MBT4834139.1 LysE family translocator [Cryomorphaceae bacterium]MBT5936435.1 LysE family translocator [Cryomorphaceae bacterium]
MDQLLLFLISSIALTLIPGPDIIFVLNQSLENKKSGLLISIGLCSGLVIHTLILVFGLSVFIETNEYLINYLKYFGTLYLFYLAYAELKTKFNVDAKVENTNLFFRGLYMNLVNPKVLLFFIAYFPNFLFSETISTSLQFLVLGSIFISQALIIFFIASIASNNLASFLKIDTKNYKLTYFKSLVFIIIGLSILL